MRVIFRANRLFAERMTGNRLVLTSHECFTRSRETNSVAVLPRSPLPSSYGKTEPENGSLTQSRAQIGQRSNPRLPQLRAPPNPGRLFSMRCVRVRAAPAPTLFTKRSFMVGCVLARTVAKQRGAAREVSRGETSEPSNVGPARECSGAKQVAKQTWAARRCRGETRTRWHAPTRLQDALFNGHGACKHAPYSQATPAAAAKPVMTSVW
jgi:hypothetical protein